MVFAATGFTSFDVLVAYLCTEEKVQEIMTAAERQKLYDAIGYEENVTSDFPKEVCYLLYFLIKTDI